MSNTRIHNTKKIIFSSLLNQVIDLLLPFINKTIIIKSLGSEFVGLTSLFSSILQVLCLAEFGFSTVIVYYLYEPLAKNDTEEINRVLTWLRSVYHIVGSVIFCGGLLCTPFLTHLIHGSYPDSINIYLLFLIYLINTGVSYFLFVYKEVLLIADQKKNVLTNIRSIISIVVNCLQFLALIIFKNYYLYVIMLILGTVSSNTIINLAVKKRYPFLKIVKNKMVLSQSQKKDLAGRMINRISYASRNALDSVIISSTLGLVDTAIYANYYLIYTAVFSLTLVFSSSIQAGVGNSIAVRSAKENYENMLDFSLMYSWIFGWCAVSMTCLYQPFMKLWVGEKLMLSNSNMILFVIYFYVICMNHIRNQYLFGNAFWWQLKWPYVFESIGNLVLNIVLGKLFGITGVLIATIVTVFLFSYLMCTRVLFKNYFTKENIWQFYRQQFYYMFVAAVGITATYLLCCMTTDNLFIRAMICVILPNLIFFILYQPCSRWKSCVMMGKRILRRQ